MGLNIVFPLVWWPDGCLSQWPNNAVVASGLKPNGESLLADFKLA